MTKMDQTEYNTEKRKWEQLSERERYQIEALLKRGISAGEIGKQLGRHKRTIEREIVKGSVIQVDSQWREKITYCADVGQQVHKKRAANKGRTLKIGHDHKLVAHIEKKIKEEKYAPDAVIGEIKEKGLRFETSICTKTLYNYIDQGLFMGISNNNLPVKKNRKKSRYQQVRKVALNNTKGRSIEERPVQIEDRAQYGHWEMDCVVGSTKACLLVLTERSIRQEMIFKINCKSQKCVIEVIDKLERRYKSEFYNIFKSITMDNGGEFLDMAGIENSCLKRGKKRTICYYAHPYSAWERGSNEVANKLIRRFVPKGTNISKLKQSEIKYIERWINNYPRKMFGYKSSNQMTA